MKNLYVTTFNEKFFNASGKAMLDSFFKNKIDDDILVCYEGFEFQEKYNYLKHKNILLCNLGNDSFLKDWLSENKNNIPPDLGGSADPKKNPTAFLRHNLRAAGWFRKIASLRIAIQKYKKNYKSIIMIDSDCKILLKIDDKIIEKAFLNYSVFYHWGDERKAKGQGPETGLVGFKMDHDGLFVAEKWINYFENKKFTRFARWDDGGVFGYVLEDIEFRRCIDLVNKNIKSPLSQSHVIDRGIFANYVIHEKGIHKKIGITNDSKK